MLQLHPVYSLCNIRKTLTGSPDPTRANGTNKPCKPFLPLTKFRKVMFSVVPFCFFREGKVHVTTTWTRLNLFIWGHSVNSSPGPTTLHHTWTLRPVRMRAVGLRLKGLLIIWVQIIEAQSFFVIHDRNRKVGKEVFFLSTHQGNWMDILFNHLLDCKISKRIL